MQNFYGFNVIIALKYVSYAVLLGIEEEITSEPEPEALNQRWTDNTIENEKGHKDKQWSTKHYTENYRSATQTTGVNSGAPEG